MPRKKGRAKTANSRSDSVEFKLEDWWTLDIAVKRFVEAFSKERKKLYCEFNNVILVADAGVTEEGLHWYYWMVKKSNTLEWFPPRIGLSRFRGNIPETQRLYF